MRQVIAKPNYKELKVKDCIVDAYQRKLNMSKVKKYAENIDYDVLGVPLVSYRNGKFYVIDGQHRVAALQMLKKPTVMCQVVEGLSYEEECEKFVKLNFERAALNYNQKFHARVEAGDAEAVQILNVLNKHNFTYSRDNAGKSTNKIGAMNVITKIVHRQGFSGLSRVLSILRGAWYGSGDSLGAAIIQGIATLLEENPTLDDNRLIKVLESVAPGYIMFQANAIAGMENISVNTGGKSKFVHVAKAMKNLYNKGLTKSKMLV